MKQFFQKIKSVSNFSNFLILIVAIIISISGIQVFKTEASTSYLGGASNSLYVGGGGILGVDSPSVGLAVLNGNVSIGTGSPSAKLHLYGTSGELVLRMQNAATGGRNWELNSKNSSGAFSIIDRTATADRILINSSGNVGIGLTNPSGKLHVNGTFYTNGKGYINGGLDIYSGGLFVGGNIQTYYDLDVPGNYWGACTYIAKSFSCTESWALICSEGEFMRGIHNNGGSNTCFDAIYCCEL